MSLSEKLADANKKAICVTLKSKNPKGHTPGQEIYIGF